MGLNLWEDTDDYIAKRAQAERDLGVVRQILFHEDDGRRRSVAYRGCVQTMQFDYNGEPEVLFHFELSEQDKTDKTKVGSKRVREVALQQGSNGWWSLDEAHLFAYEGGTILAQALFDLGFEPKKRGRVSKLEKGAIPPRVNYDSPREAMTFVDRGIMGRESDYIRFGFTSPVEGLSGEYDIRVNNNGRLFFALQPYPTGIAPEKYYGFTHGQVAEQQKDFSIVANNVKLENRRAVIVKILTAKGSFDSGLLINSRLSGREMNKAFEAIGLRSVVSRA